MKRLIPTISGVLAVLACVDPSVTYAMPATALAANRYSDPAEPQASQATQPGLIEGEVLVIDHVLQTVTLKNTRWLGKLGPSFAMEEDPSHSGDVSFGDRSRLTHLILPFPGAGRVKQPKDLTLDVAAGRSHRLVPLKPGDRVRIIYFEREGKLTADAIVKIKPPSRRRAGFPRSPDLNVCKRRERHEESSPIGGCDRHCHQCAVFTDES